MTTLLFSRQHRLGVDAVEHQQPLINGRSHFGRVGNLAWSPGSVILLDLASA
jgi:hypothetical protein